MSTDLLFPVPSSPSTLASFVVAGEPVALGRARVAMRGKTPHLYTPEESASHKEAVAWAAKAAGVVPCAGAIGLDLVASWLYPRSWSEKEIRAELAALAADRSHFGVPKITRPDADNLTKLVMDALNPSDGWAGAWKDDAQVVMIRSAKVWGPRAETHIRIWRGAPPVWGRWW